MAEPFLGQIELFAFASPPKGWTICAGQLLPIAQNSALFSLLGTSFGGDGRTNFALPDLRGAAAIGQGQGPGLTPRPVGAVAGTETATLTVDQIVIAHPTPAIGSAGSLTASTKRMVSNTEARLAFAVLTTERKAA